MGAMKERVVEAAELLNLPVDVLMAALDDARVVLPLAVLDSLVQHAHILTDGGQAAVATMAATCQVDRPARIVGLFVPHAVTVPFAAARLLAGELGTNAERYDVEHWPAAQELIIRTGWEA